MAADGDDAIAHAGIAPDRSHRYPSHPHANNPITPASGILTRSSTSSPPGSGSRHKHRRLSVPPESSTDAAPDSHFATDCRAAAYNCVTSISSGATPVPFPLRVVINPSMLLNAPAPCLAPRTKPHDAHNRPTSETARGKPLATSTTGSHKHSSSRAGDDLGVDPIGRRRNKERRPRSKLTV